MSQVEELAALVSPNWRMDKEPDPEAPKPLPFYPSQKHLTKNWKAEQSLTEQDVVAIALARRQAEDAGVISSEIGKYMLPIAMVEGWGSGMGVKGDNAFYASQRFKSAINKMGLEENKDYVTSNIPGKGQHIIPREGRGNGPRWAAAILGEKAAVARGRGKSTPEDVVKAYNGKGKAKEEFYGALIPADVDVYLGKVKEAHDLILHPKNYGIAQRFAKEYGR